MVVISDVYIFSARYGLLYTQNLKVYCVHRYYNSTIEES